MDKATVARSALGRSQSLHFYARRGCTLLVLRGAISVSRSVWLAGQMVHQEFRLSEGDQHVVQDAGWIVIFALEGAEVASWEPAKRHLLPACTRLLSWLVRRRRSPAGAGG